MHRGVVLAVVVLVGTFGAVAGARAADVYEGHTKIGSVQRLTPIRYKVIAGYSRIGFVTRATRHSTRWSVYKGRTRIGYVKPTSRNRWDIFSRRSVNEGYVTHSAYTGRWNIYSHTDRIGYVTGGSGGPAAGAVLLLLLS